MISISSPQVMCERAVQYINASLGTVRRPLGIAMELKLVQSSKHALPIVSRVNGIETAASDVQ